MTTSPKGSITLGPGHQGQTLKTSRAYLAGLGTTGVLIGSFFLLLTVGLVVYLSGLVSKSSEDQMMMATIAAGVVITGVVTSLAFTRVVGGRVRERARTAKQQEDPSALPEQ